MTAIKIKDPINGTEMTVRSKVYPTQGWLDGKKANGYGNVSNSVLNKARTTKRPGKNGWKG